VLLDFGIVGEVSTRGQLEDRRSVGTASYMAPEQVRDGRVGPSADWYSVGVVLYLALTGSLPFSGQPNEVIERKQKDDPPPPSALMPGIPPDLEQLCLDLLQRQPSCRPDGAAVLRRLGIEPQEDALTATTMSGVLLGREAELLELHDAFGRVTQGSTESVIVCGESGVGKSFLVRHFVSEVRAAHQQAWVLSGRCYEREAVPFKAVDGCIDELARYLKKVKAEERRLLLPPEARLLGTLFPVLAGIVGALEQGAVPPDPLELRARAFFALRELLKRIGQRRPLMVVIDDLQWADADSLALLRVVLLPPAPPRLLLLVTGRSKDAASELAWAEKLPGMVRRMVVSRLEPAVARELALHLLGAADGSEVAHQIASEAGGHPLFIDELVRQRRSHEDELAPLHLDDALWSRVTRLDPAGRQLIELLAVAGAPVPQEIALHATAQTPQQFDGQLTALSVARLLRTGGMRRKDTLEPYHDRVREAVAGRLLETVRRSWHGRLALAYETLRPSDHEALLRHWQQAGQRERAASHAVAAAELAAKLLAFHRAAQLYGQALELSSAEGADRRSLQAKQAAALRNAGRESEAADVYLSAATRAPLPSPEEVLELQKRACEHLLRSGRTDEGIAILRELLSGLGIELPKSSVGSLAQFLIARTRIQLEGALGQRAQVAPLSRRQELQLELCFMGSLSLVLAEPLLGLVLGNRFAALAYASGDLHQIVLANAVRASYLIMENEAKRAQVGELLQSAAKLATVLRSDYHQNYVRYMNGLAAAYSGKWHEASTLLAEAEAIFTERCTGVGWELDNIRFTIGFALCYLGKLPELSQLTRALVADAETRSDLHFLGNLYGFLMPVVQLQEDAPQRALADLAAAEKRRMVPERSVQMLFHRYSLGNILLYQGRAQQAEASLAEVKHQPFFRFGLKRFEAFYGIWNDVCGRSALAALIHSGRQDKTLFRELERCLEALSAMNILAVRALRELLHSGLLLVRGGRTSAQAALQAAERYSAESDMPLFAAVARYRRGQLSQGEERKRLMNEALLTLRTAEIRVPERWIAMYHPADPDQLS